MKSSSPTQKKGKTFREAMIAMQNATEGQKAILLYELFGAAIRDDMSIDGSRLIKLLAEQL